MAPPRSGTAGSEPRTGATGQGSIVWSRRELILAGGLSVLLAGCSTFGGPAGTTDTDDPDYGNDSYGIYLENSTKKSQKIHISVSVPFEDSDPVFDKTIEIEGRAIREWDRVLTESKDYAVVARPIAEGDGMVMGNTFWVTPGGEDAPSDPNVWIVLDTVSTNSGEVIVAHMGFKKDLTDR